MAAKIQKSDAQWRARLTPLQYNVARRGGTERPFSGEYRDPRPEAAGVYACVCCGQALFGSAAQFDAGNGWPAFTAPLAPQALRLGEDYGWLMRRTEVLCARCDAHLGHVLEDGEDGAAPGGRRYCINSAALRFDPACDGGPRRAPRGRKL